MKDNMKANGSICIISANIRCACAKDGDNSWAFRKEVCANILRGHAPDIICFQEMWHEQLEDLLERLPGYGWHGIADEPAGRNPQNAVFYRKERLARVCAGSYWLSETPHVPGSRSWDSVCIRLAAWLRLEDRQTGREFRIVNTHLDHRGQTARENQARLINEDARVYPEEYPQVLAGDMNAECDNPAIQIFADAGWRDTWRTVNGDEDPGRTFHGFQGFEYDGSIGKIDWIFTRGQAAAVSAAVIRDSIDGRFPSDHFYLKTELTVD